jgi:hypothetical protein
MTKKTKNSESVIKIGDFISKFSICPKTCLGQKCSYFWTKKDNNSLNEHFMTFLALNSCSLFNFEYFTKN